jgi:murein DD-endopeptidase MepM/ murein hydrolase activator NlpD
MKRARRDSWAPLTGAAAGFVGGVALMAVLQGSPVTRATDPAGEDCGQAVLDSDAAPAGGAAPSTDAAPVAPPAPARPGAPPRIGADPVADLRERDLLLPVEGFDRATLYGSFAEKRGSDRLHEAIDMLAPRNTPVLAVEDGTIARLFSSKAGGITVYQFDPGVSYVYYYAHLQRYAAGLTEGAAVRRGQVIGYVGTSGNAPPDTPHLHFAIFKLSEKKQWWEGVPIDPFEVLR